MIGRRGRAGTTVGPRLPNSYLGTGGGGDDDDDYNRGT